MGLLEQLQERQREISEKVGSKQEPAFLPGKSLQQTVRGYCALREPISHTIESNHVADPSNLTWRDLKMFWAKHSIEKWPHATRANEQEWVQIYSRHSKKTLDALIYVDGEDISFVRLQAHLLPQIHNLLSRIFWPGIHVDESQSWPEFTIVALYKARIVIGVGLMTPTGYITYLAVHPEWRGGSIGKRMLFHLIQAAHGQDITLHISVTNPAMILYQSFGFKVEEFIQQFYEKYYPEKDTRICKHAFFMRLKRSHYT
jgi:ribosomal protein S18 acetylase RimI-like enzyme